MRPRKYLSKYCCTDVRWKSTPNFTSCLFIFHEKLSRTWTLLSTRWRGTLLVEPSCANPPTSVMGMPESNGGAPLQPAVLVAAQRPIELGWKLWSPEKKPSAKRFQPK